MAVVPLKVAVVIVEAVCFNVSVVVVTSHTEHAQPFGAVAVLPKVIVGAQAIAPERNDPAVAPPTKVFSVQPPFDVNFRPAEMKPEASAKPLTSLGVVLQLEEKPT